MSYFLGVDIGSSKTHVVITNQHGQLVGFGRGGPGNHQVVGYEGMYAAMQAGLQPALEMAGIAVDQIAGAGFGISGYDWPSDLPPMLELVVRLGITAPRELVNDAILGLAAGAEQGWGVAVVSGTGCNCWGWDQNHRIGRVTGMGLIAGEAAGASEMVLRAMQLVAYAWTRRGPATALADLFIQMTGAKDLEDLLEGYTTDRYEISPAAAPAIFQVAEAGDAVARELITWAGTELGEMANAVIRQLEIQALEFEVVMLGSMFEGGPLLIQPMRAKIHQLAPKAKLVRLQVPPVLGAVVIGMQAAGIQVTPEVRQALACSIKALNDAVEN